MNKAIILPLLTLSLLTTVNANEHQSSAQIMQSALKQMESIAEKSNTTKVIQQK